MKHLIRIAVVMTILAACGPTTNPPTGPNTSWPCGIHGRSCGNGMCCETNDVCGFDGPFSRCEAGYCCFDGPHWPGATREKRKQWAEVTR